MTPSSSVPRTRWSHPGPPRSTDDVPPPAATPEAPDFGRLIVVANRAPVRLTDGEWQPSVGGLATALLPVLKKHGGVWVSMKSDDDAPERQPYPADAPDFTIRRVPMSETERHNYYEGMANSVLWPVSHYLRHLELDRAFIED